MAELSVSQLIEDLAEDLQIEMLGGEEGLGRKIRDTQFQKNGLPLSGYLDAVHSDRIQIWGNTEVSYLNSLELARQESAVRAFFGLPLCAVLVATKLPLPEAMGKISDAASVPLLRTLLPSMEMLNRLTAYLELHLSPREHLHGVLVDLYGVGVLIQGKSGIGKSECALHLVTRGHRLVADDVVDVQLRGNELIGRSTDMLKHHMEVRGLGILNLKDLFGVVAIRYEKVVDLVVELVHWHADVPFDRLGIDLQTKEVLGQALPMVRIPVAPGRNVPTLIEIAARNLLLQRMGYFSADEFSRNLSRQIALESSGASGDLTPEKKP